jgi:transposase
MMGTKARIFTPVTAVSLDELVPANHFYRHLDRAVDLSFVRDLVKETYAERGRPSIDPVVFFKLQLVMFFDGMRSERQLIALAADRLSVRWFVGYNLDEPLPDHSSLTRIRERYGVELFQRFFEAIVDQCQQAGLVWGKELFVDARHPCMPMPPLIRSSRVLPSMRTCENCSLQERKESQSSLLIWSHSSPRAKLYPHLQRPSVKRQRHKARPQCLLPRSVNPLVRLPSHFLSLWKTACERT